MSPTHASPNPDFYRNTLRRLLSEGVLSQDDRILCVCAGDRDRDAMMALGFGNVTISNLGDRSSSGNAERFAPYAWSHEDVEKLSFGDDSFDIAIVHSGLHHLRCPQRGIAEMYRVASKGILAFEPYRNLFTRIGVAFGFGQEYETSAVFQSDCRQGGAANTAIPNYVYRFTADDIRRTIQAYNPVAKHSYRFWYTIRIPDRLAQMRKRSLATLVRMASPLLLFLGRHCRFFANNLAFLVLKPRIPGDLFPWLKVDGSGIVPNADYLGGQYIRKRRE